MQHATDDREPRLCRRCILPDTVPGITLNAEGVCNLCEAEERNSKPKSTLGEQAFRSALAPSRRGAAYDVLCLYSGGKDSTFMLYVLSQVLKLRVLAMTLDNWFISPQTHTNIKNTLHKLGNVDHLMVKPAWSTVQKVFQAGFSFERGTPLGDKAFMMGHACYSCFGLICIHAGQIALQKGIRNIVLGTTPGQLTQKSLQKPGERFDSASEGFRSTIWPLMKEMARRDDSFAHWTHMSILKFIRTRRLRLVPLYDFLSYDEAHIYRTVEEKLGWVRPRDTDSCSTNCQINAVGVHVHRKLYQISPYTIPLAHDVRIGLMTREAALEAVNAPVNPKIVTHIAAQLGLESLVADLIPASDQEPADGGPG
jgi:tRNA(Ile)-lysidine synthase TilS/MesJ